MDIFLIILGALCLLIGLIGCIAPVLPGVPLSYAGLLLLHATDKVQFSWQFLLIWGIITIVVQVLDYFVPIWGTKVLGGTKQGVLGSTIGLIAGFFLGPWGIILGPFVGAVLFEWWSNPDIKNALRSGWGAFVGLMTGTILKLICSGMMIYYFVRALV